MVAQLHVVDEVRRRLPMQWVGRLDLVGPAASAANKASRRSLTPALSSPRSRVSTNITHGGDARSRIVNVTWRPGERLAPGRRLPGVPLADSRAVGATVQHRPGTRPTVPLETGAERRIARGPKHAPRSGTGRTSGCARGRSLNVRATHFTPDDSSRRSARWRGATAVARVRSIVGIDQAFAAGSGSCGSARAVPTPGAGLRGRAMTSVAGSAASVMPADLSTVGRQPGGRRSRAARRHGGWADDERSSRPAGPLRRERRSPRTG